MRRLAPALAGLLLALALPLTASAHNITNVQVDCDGHAILVSGKLFASEPATVTVTGPGGYSESFFADQDAEWTVTLPLGPNGDYAHQLAGCQPRRSTSRSIARRRPRRRHAPARADRDGDGDRRRRRRPRPRRRRRPRLHRDADRDPTETADGDADSDADCDVRTRDQPLRGSVRELERHAAHPRPGPVVGLHLLLNNVEVQADANGYVAVAAGHLSLDGPQRRPGRAGVG